MNNKIIINELQKEINNYKNDKSKIFKIKALKNAIYSIQKCNENIISGEDAKKKCSNIGKGISQRIDKILELNKNKLIINNYDDSLNKITGVGSSRIELWNKQNIFNINDLKNAINKKEIKVTHHIEIGIKYYEDFQKKISSNLIDDFYLNFKKIIKNIDDELIFEFCGSYRRGCKKCGDIDILISHKNNKNYLSKIVNILTDKKFLIDNLTTTKGGKKYMGVLMLEFPCRIDIRFVKYNEFYTSLLYFTGSKNFNIMMRKKALSYNYTLNEYTLKNNKNNENNFLIKSEEDIFNYLNIDYVNPIDRNI